MTKPTAKAKGAEVSRARIARNIARGFSSYLEGRPGLALMFFHKALQEIQHMIRQIEKQTIPTEEAKHDHP